MHVQTHVLSGWCVANLLPLSPCERMLCMVAASVPDLDGLSILAGQEAYWEWHHTLGHNLPLGVAASLVLALLSRRRLPASVLLFLLYLALFHLHLVMDLYGSGPGWGIHYLWPLHRLWPRAQWVWSTRDAWEFYSWQNITAALAMVACTAIIAIRQRRTPLEVLMPSLDRKLVRWLRRERRAEPDVAVAQAISPGLRA